MTESRCAEIFASSANARVVVVGDVILDQFMWGRVRRISPEAPVPVVELQRESFMPGGAANVAFNLSRLGVRAELFGVIGPDQSGKTLSSLLLAEGVGVRGLVRSRIRPTSVKMRIVSLQQQITRLDREVVTDLEARDAASLNRWLTAAMERSDAVIVGDYGKGVISQRIINDLRRTCRRRKCWISVDPKPTHALNLTGLSLITPNRLEAFALAGLADTTCNSNPSKDRQLLKAADTLLKALKPKVLLITLGEIGMLLCVGSKPAVHIKTVAKEVFDVSGAGDTVIASFTMAMVAGASPLEAAQISNHAAGIVVGKFGTATVTAKELIESFRTQ